MNPETRGVRRLPRRAVVVLESALSALNTTTLRHQNESRATDLRRSAIFVALILTHYEQAI
jgi:hypothetical protein